MPTGLRVVPDRTQPSRESIEAIEQELGYLIERLRVLQKRLRTLRGSTDAA